MNTTIAFISAVVLAAGLTGCGSSDNGATDITKPIAPITQTPTGHVHQPAPRCRDKWVCPE